MSLSLKANGVRYTEDLQVISFAWENFAPIFGVLNLACGQAVRRSYMEATALCLFSWWHDCYKLK